MIILDEQLLDPQLARAVALSVRGRVRHITDLGPHRVIKDDAIPALLRTVRHPIFVTPNWTDFWERTAPDARYCILCFALPRERRLEIPLLMRRLFSLPDFRTRADRMGKVVLVSPTRIRYYQSPRGPILTVAWPK